MEKANKKTALCLGIILIGVCMIVISFGVFGTKKLVLGNHAYKYKQISGTLLVLDKTDTRVIYDKSMIENRVEAVDTFMTENPYIMCTWAGFGYQVGDDGKAFCFYLDDEGTISRLESEADEERIQLYRESVDALSQTEIACLGQEDLEEYKELIQCVLLLRKENIQQYTDILKLCGYSSNQQLEAIRIYSDISKCLSYLER